MSANRLDRFDQTNQHYAMQSVQMANRRRHSVNLQLSQCPHILKHGKMTCLIKRCEIGISKRSQLGS
jgi:hypothetical protein